MRGVRKSRKEDSRVGEDNHVEFSNTKDEVITFTRRRKQELKTGIAVARIIMRGHIRVFLIQTTRWGGVYFDTGLQFKGHKNLSLKKAMRAKDRVRCLTVMR